MRPALWMATALALGIAGAEWLRPHPALALVALLAPAAWALCDRSRRMWAVLLLVAFMGAARHSYDQTAGRGNILAWEGRKATVVGTVVTEPQLKEPKGVSYTIAVEAVEGVEATGKLYVSQNAERSPAYGERVRFNGTLKPPLGPRVPGGFDQEAFLARQRVYLTVQVGQPDLLGPGKLNPVLRAAVSTRLYLEGALRRAMPARYAALMAGLLFGSRSDLPDDIKEAFKATGVFHLLAVSGGNVAMVILPLLLMLRYAGLPRRWASAGAIPLVLFFVFLTGASASVMRAGLMAVLVLLADVLRREKDALNSLGAAALLLMLYTPGLLFDVGFQFSAVATMGILLFARPLEFWLQPYLQRWLGERTGGWAATGLSVTLAAQVVVEPISLFHFGAFSVVAPLTNLLVVAFLEPVIYLGTVAVLIGLVALPVAWFLGLAVRAGLWLLITLVKLIALLPFAYVEVGHLPFSGLVLWYAALALCVWPPLREWLRAGAARALAWLRQGARQRMQAAACACLLLTTGFTWHLALTDPPETLKVTFLDVGQGDSLLIQAPGGRNILVDAGPAAEADPASGRRGYDAGEAVVVPFLARSGVGKVDLIVVTHPHQDHAGGAIAVLKDVPVGAVLDIGMASEAPAYPLMLAEAASRGIPVRRPVAGEQIQLAPDMALHVLNPQREFITGTRSDINSNSIVLLLQYRQVRFLLTGDMEGVVEERLVEDGLNLRADVLKVAHHGSGYSSTAAFLAGVKPSYAVISMGRGNLFGHPHPETLKRLADAGAQVLRTDRHGRITIRTDGYQVRVGLEKGRPGMDLERPVGIVGRKLIFAW